MIEQYFTTDINTNIYDSESSNTKELIPNGKSIRVTDRNKDDFIVKKCHYIAYKCVSD